MVYLVSLVVHDCDANVTYEAIEGAYRTRIRAMQAQVDALVEYASDDSVVDVKVTPYVIN